MDTELHPDNLSRKDDYAQTGHGKLPFKSWMNERWFVRIDLDCVRLEFAIAVLPKIKVFKPYFTFLYLCFLKWPLLWLLFLHRAYSSCCSAHFCLHFSIPDSNRSFQSSIKNPPLTNPMYLVIYQCDYVCTEDSGSNLFWNNGTPLSYYTQDRNINLHCQENIKSHTRCTL